MAVTLSTFARELKVETAFDVLAAARKLKASGKDVVELQIGDSPFPSTASARRAGKAAIDAGQTHYGPSIGLPELRAAAAELVRREQGVEVSADHVVVAPGAKVFEQFFCEAFLNPGDEVLVFSPQFPTYGPNLQRRGAKMVLSVLRQENGFRPNLADVEAFVTTSPRPKAVFLNSPHNPTGGVATEDDIRGLCDLIRGRDIALFSDEPYNHMVWVGRHVSPITQPGMLEQTLAVYTFSKSYSMSGWRLGYGVTSPALATVMGKLLNTALSCVPPFVQLAGAEALRHDTAERDEAMAQFRAKVERLTHKLKQVEGVTVVPPAGTFYVFPNIAPICNRLGLSSHGVAMFLLEAADPTFGVACLGGECFGPAGAGFLRFSCAEPDERLAAAIDFLPRAFAQVERARAFATAHPEYRLTAPYALPATKE